jgi:hypothetical protein
MTGKRIQVDLGQMSMPVGEDRSSDFSPGNGSQRGADADRGDVDRLRAILRGRGGNRSNVGIGGLGATPDLAGTGAPAFGPTGLDAVPTPAPPEEGPLIAETGRRGDFTVDRIGEELESLWIGDGTRSRREVRLRLRRQVLPHTSVRLFEAAGRLQVDMTVGQEDIRIWLAGRLPALAESLGARLSRPLRLVVTGVRPARLESDSVDWPAGSRP